MSENEKRRESRTGRLLDAALPCQAGLHTGAQCIHSAGAITALVSARGTQERVGGGGKEREASYGCVDPEREDPTGRTAFSCPPEFSCSTVGNSLLPVSLQCGAVPR